MLLYHERTGKTMVRRVHTTVMQGSIPALLWKRIAAFAIDILVLDLTILSPFQGVLMDALPSNFSISALDQVHVSGTLTATLIAMGLLAALYFALCESMLGQTVGKMLFRLRVAGVASPPGFWRCLLRSVFLLPIFPFAMFWLIDPLYMFFTRSSQRLLERLSATATIESSPFTFKVSTVG